MPSLIHREQFVSPADLDDYLAMGYRIAGQAVYTSEYIKLKENQLVSVLPLRLGLKNYEPRKNQRKSKRKNDTRFRSLIGPASLDLAEEKALNQLYKLAHPEKVIDDLSYHVKGRQTNERLIRTWQTKVYDGHRLVATSFFDLGDNSAYSKQGIYDPAYAKWGLGIYTMLLEIDFCKWAGRSWYYPGYVGVEIGDFDYKLRLGSMEYFDFRSQSWQLFDKTKMAQAPLSEMEQKLHQLSELLRESGIENQLQRYYYGDVRYAMRMAPDRYLDGPFLLNLGPTQADDQNTELVVTYELVGEYPFGLMEVERCFSAAMHPRPVFRDDTYDHVSKARRKLHFSRTAEEMCVFIRQLERTR
ncbi:MAG: hypothetical protein AAF433_18775 [Bacteroidota bacterium]